jgi:branched-chain amino acid transport system permease protein
MIVAIGLDFLVGYTGQVSLGHGAYVALGAYGSALLTIKPAFRFGCTTRSGHYNRYHRVANRNVIPPAVRTFLSIATLDSRRHATNSAEMDNLTNGYYGLKPQAYYRILHSGH